MREGMAGQKLPVSIRVGSGPETKVGDFTSDPEGKGVERGLSALLRAIADELDKIAGHGGADIPHAGSSAPILEFTGEYFFLSNFSPSPIRNEGGVWPTAEHLFQAKKCRQPVDKTWIWQAETPGDAKRRGRMVTPIIPGWDQRRKAFMLEVTLSKFTQNKYLAEQLVATGDRLLVEGNTWGDTYWGQVDGAGANNLGKILMMVRAVLAQP